jgi:hypothetical protein
MPALNLAYLDCGEYKSTDIPAESGRPANSDDESDKYEVIEMSDVNQADMEVFVVLTCQDELDDISEFDLCDYAELNA